MEIPILTKIKSEILTPITYLLFAVATGYFLFGVLMFIQNQDDETARTAGKQHMFWGIIGIAIMLSVWGILNVISQSTRGFS